MSANPHIHLCPRGICIVVSPLQGSDILAVESDRHDMVSRVSTHVCMTLLNSDRTAERRAILAQVRPLAVRASGLGSFDSIACLRPVGVAIFSGFKWIDECQGGHLLALKRAVETELPRLSGTQL